MTRVQVLTGAFSVLISLAIMFMPDVLTSAKANQLSRSQAGTVRLEACPPLPLVLSCPSAPAHIAL